MKLSTLKKILWFPVELLHLLIIGLKILILAAGVFWPAMKWHMAKHRLEQLRETDRIDRLRNPSKFQLTSL